MMISFMNFFYAICSCQALEMSPTLIDAAGVVLDECEEERKANITCLEAVIRITLIAFAEATGEEEGQEGTS